MRFIPLLVTTFAAACSNEQAKAPEVDPAPQSESAAQPEAAKSPSLEVLWLAEGFDAPEGVALSPDGAYFISNVSGDAVQKDGAGWISKVAADGTVIAAKFVDGLDAPKGMAVLDGFLYVSDIDQIRTFDAASGAAGAVIAIPGGTFLNDATVWRNEVYVSDSGTGRIWRLSAEGPVVWREGEELIGVNGLVGDGDRMLISTMTTGSLFEATASGGWTQIATGMIDSDGIGVVPASAGGGYLVSSWPGEIWHVATDGSTTSILNTRDAGILQNDLTTFGDVVIVPNWMPGTVTAWRATASN